MRAWRVWDKIDSRNIVCESEAESRKLFLLNRLDGKPVGLLRILCISKEQATLEREAELRGIVATIRGSKP